MMFLLFRKITSFLFCRIDKLDAVDGVLCLNYNPFGCPSLDGYHP